MRRYSLAFTSPPEFFGRHLPAAIYIYLTLLAKTLDDFFCRASHFSAVFFGRQLSFSAYILVLLSTIRMLSFLRREAQK